jgi:predicted transcriptional regulator
VLREPLPGLGDLEREVMQLVWRHGPVTAEKVRTRLSRTLKESTVRTVLRRLEDKGYVTHAVEGRTFHFRAVEKRGVVAARAVKQITDWFADGSLEEVLLGLIENRTLDSRQLQALCDKIAKARKK